MKKTVGIVLVSCAVIVAGCRGGSRGGTAPEGTATSPAPGGEAQPAAPAPAHDAPVAQDAPGATPAAPRSSIALRVGANMTDDSVAGQNVFAPGDEVMAAVDVSVLPPGSIVKVSWFDASGGVRGEEQKPVPGGKEWLLFSAHGSRSWTEGGYRVDASASTGGTATQTFTIRPASEEQPTEPG